MDETDRIESQRPWNTDTYISLTLPGRDYVMPFHRKIMDHRLAGITQQLEETFDERRSTAVGQKLRR